jgi:tRNA nucleotidyltransferase (CCA-adding enzyme)
LTFQGKEVVAALGADKPGPWVGKVLDDVIEWQLGHPQEAKDNCLRWLKNRRDSYLPAMNFQPKTPSKRPRIK